MAEENEKSEIDLFLDGAADPEEDNLDNDDEFFGRTQGVEADDGEEEDTPSPSPDADADADEDAGDKDTPPAGDIPAAEEGDEKTPPEKDEPSDEPDELATLREQNAKLLERIEGLTPTEAKPPKEGEDVPTPTPQAAPGEPMDFIGDEDLDDILADKDKFNGVLTKIVTTSMENILRSMPQVVNAQVKQQQTFQTYVDEFYKENEDLAPVRKTVGAVANEVHSEHPDWKLNQIFEETAARTRKMLGLKAKALGKGEDTPSVEEPSPASSQKKPALPGTQRGQKGKGSVPLTGQSKHISDVL